MIGIMTFNKSVQLHKISTKETVEISRDDIPNCDKYWKLFEKLVIEQLLNRLGLTNTLSELDSNNLLRNNYVIELSENNMDSIINYILNIKPTYTENTSLQDQQVLPITFIQSCFLNQELKLYWESFVFH